MLARAQAETELRYGPEVRGLQSLLQQATGERRLAVRQARGTAEGVIAATRAAIPQARNVYAGAQRGFAEANTDVQRALGAGYQGSAAQREAAGDVRRLAESRAGAVGELVNRQVDAATAREFAIRQARSRFVQDRDKIRQQAQDLESEMGQYLATTYRDLSEADRDYRQEQRRIRISERDSRRLMRATLADITGYDPATGRPTAETRQQRGEARRENRRIDIAERAETRQQRQQRQENRRQARGGVAAMTPTQRRAFRVQIDRAVASVKQGVFETGEGDDKREIPLTRLYRRAPKKWGPRIRTQIAAQYGNEVADRAMRRLGDAYFGRRRRNQAIRDLGETFQGFGFG